jgi:hypothetical protein
MAGISMKGIARILLTAAALAVPVSAWAAVTTTSIAAGTADWADLGIPSAGSVMIVQPTSAETIFAIADVKPGITPALGFHLDPNVLTQITLNTPTTTHVWAFQPSKGSVMSTGGYVIVTK